MCQVYQKVFPTVTISLPANRIREFMSAEAPTVGERSETHMKVTFGDGLKVNVDTGSFIIPTDQQVAAGGNGSAPEPFTYFLASLASCAGIYVLSFCRQRGIDPEGIEILQKPVFNPETRMISDIHLEVLLPEAFPDKYRKAIMRAVDQCAVKRHILTPPAFHIRTVKAGELAEVM